MRRESPDPEETLPVPEDGVLGSLEPHHPAPGIGVGSTVGAYRLDLVLGSGAHGQVFGARHLTLDTEHAVKIVVDPDPGARARLLTEARVQARVRHPNVVAVQDVIEVPGAVALVMERVDGPTLEGWLRTHQPGVGEAEALFRGIVAGVAAAHGAGAIHRDLKPANILLEGEPPTARVTDFGLAREDGGLAMTRTGMAMGTPAWMAPEQFRDAKRVDARADLFSLGAILYEILCGRRPFDQTGMGPLFTAIAAGDYPDPAELRPEMPDRLVAVIRGCLEPEAGRRVASCAALEGLLGGERRAGNYLLEEQIGAGGMGEVWRARHVHLGRAAAVKLIRPELLGRGHDDEAVARFTREAKAIAALRSPNTVQLHDFGRMEDGRLYAAMELLEGRTLRELVVDEGPLPAEGVRQLMVQACRSLAEAHEAGFVHRDIKPANLFLCRDPGGGELLKVLDFGLVAAGGEANVEVVGTPAFMAPEQFDAGPVDGRTDLYALGCVAHWLLTGEPPFEAEAPVKAAFAHHTLAAPSSGDRAPHPVPAALERLVLKCLEKAPADRPASAAVLMAALEALAPAPEGAPSPTWPWWAPVGLAAAAVLVAGLAWGALGSDPVPTAAPEPAPVPEPVPEVQEPAAPEVEAAPTPEPKTCWFQDADSLLPPGQQCCDRGERAPGWVLSEHGCDEGWMCLRWGAECP